MKHLNWLLILFFTLTIINYPNPFNPKGGEVATFECTSDSALNATLYIYDMSARRLLQQAFNLQVGTSRTTWNGYTDSNELAGNGVYLYRLIDGATKQSLAKGKLWIINR